MENKRTHTCGELNSQHIGRQVVVMGWIRRRRDHGGIIFIDLCDRYGLVQISFNSDTSPELYEEARNLRGEYVVAINGVVKPRPEGMVNRKLATGEIEIEAKRLELLNEAKTPPFEIEDHVDASEDLRFTYRYLDLRRPEMQKSMLVRHKVYQIVRRYFSENNFIEIETPFFIKSTPEGARDYLVPSRINKGKFYALPQSPQTYKQLLMIAGFDRYFQIVRCFRDEDLRADRQPEFTQIDVEMSFVDEEDVFCLVEGLMALLLKEVVDNTLELPLPRLSYAEAMSRFGTDKPDMRFGLEITDVSDLVKDGQFRVFSETVHSGGIVAGLTVPDAAAYSRKKIDEFTELVKELGGKGLVTIKVNESGKWEGSVAKFFSDEDAAKINETMAAAAGSLLFLVADEAARALTLLGALRIHLGESLQLINSRKYSLLWVTDFPLLEFSEEEQRHVSRHHPFTAPKEEDLGRMSSHPEEVRAKAYDLVFNGHEIAGGSIRIHDAQLQEQVFSILNIGKEEAQRKFGFLLEALQYGAPPHGGIAFGFDRLVMILAGKKSLREVIAFPKTTRALSLMDGAPTAVDDEQLKSLGLKLRE